MGYNGGMASLYVVATPIGNLGDMTYRAVEVLQSVDLVLCEDTRVTTKLLRHYNISVPTLSYHAQSAPSRTQSILEGLRQDQNLALVSDAGTPCLSDPGVQLIHQILAADFEVTIIPIPGASALTTAFSVAGLSGNHFTFLGFLPHKKGRETLFEEIARSKRPVIFYESPHRVRKTLESLHHHLGEERRIVIARELTKIHEHIMRGSASELLHYFTQHPDRLRGEFVVMIDTL